MLQAHYPRGLADILSVKFGIQLRLFSWLVVVALPVAVACVFTVHVVETRLTEKVIAGLENDHRLEAARIEGALEAYVQHARVLSHEQSVREALIDGSRTELDRITQKLLMGSNMFQSGVTDIRLVTNNGDSFGQTPGYTWEPLRTDLVESAARTLRPVFGDAFVNSEGAHSLGMVAPVFDDAPAGQSVLGYLMLEMQLGPIVDLVVAHEGLGETSESHIAQPTATGDAQFITLMRFKRDAAFNFTVPKAKDKPINWSLESPTMRVVREPDYRAIDSMLAIGTLASTGWGLVVKIDSAEAFAPLTEIRKLIWAAGAASVFLIIVSWLAMVRPMAKRLRSVAALAERVAAGDYECAISDTVGDEVGRVANTINQLASDLARDQALREEAERNLKYHAEHDALTGLYNRKHLEDVVKSWAHTQGDRVCSVLFLDLDGFKPINDQFGHHVGDEILVGIATALTSLLPEQALVGRWGGDEFVVLLPDADKAQASQSVRLITERFSRSFDTSAGEQTLGCSIGSSTMTGVRSLETCISRADADMYRAKERRKVRRSREGTAVHVLRQGLLEKRVEVHYQPVVQAIEPDAFQVIGAEALVRIRDEHGHLQAPGAFLNDIRDADISTTLDMCVLAKGLEDLADWRNQELVASDFFLGVNLYGRTTRTTRLPGAIAQWTNEFGVPPENLLLELTEDAGMLDAATLSAIQGLGVRLAVDNVSLLRGNFEPLASVGPELVKFDRDWISQNPGFGDANDTSDVQSRRDLVLAHMIDMCASLGVRCIVGGVETDSQLAALRALGVQCFQGHLFSEALSASRFRDRLRENSIGQSLRDPASTLKKVS